MLVNLFALYLIVKTREWRNQSTRLVLIVSTIDIGNSLITNTWLTIYIIINKFIDCQVKILMNAFCHIFIYGSSYMFSVIALDWFLRIVFLQDYQTKFNKRRYIITIVGYAILVFIQSLLTWIAPTFLGPKSISKVTVPLNSIVFISAIILYVLSIWKLRGIAQNSISVENSSLIKMASFYLITYFC